MLDPIAGAEPFVETYCSDGVWMSRRSDADEPFSSGGSMNREIAAAAEVARWAQIKHVIRNADGTIAEIDTYGSGPYPHRSPTRTAGDGPVLL